MLVLNILKITIFFLVNLKLKWWLYLSKFYTAYFNDDQKITTTNNHGIHFFFMFITTGLVNFIEKKNIN